MKKREYRKGEVFGDLTVTGQAESKCGKARVILKCKCGMTVIQYLGNLYAPSVFVKSCGCNRMKRKKSRAQGPFSSLAQAFYLGRDLCLDE